MPTQSFFAHWYFHLPNLILTVLMYALIVRYILSLLLPADAVIVRIVNGVTHPVVRGVGAITPRIVPAGGILLFAIVWLFAARIALFLGLVLMGFRPRLG